MTLGLSAINTLTARRFNGSQELRVNKTASTPRAAAERNIAPILVDEYRLNKVADVIPGGETAQDSIYNALKKAESENAEDSIVLLHDGVRPFVSYEVISNNIRSVQEKGNAITCTPCFETIMISKDGSHVDSVPYRKETFAAPSQQPYGYTVSNIFKCNLSPGKVPRVSSN